MIIVLLFVIIAGAIAGAFVFLSQVNPGGAATAPGVSSGQAGVLQNMPSDTRCTIPVRIVTRASAIVHIG